MLYLGSDTRAYTEASNLDGAIDEACIFNEVLSSEDIASLYSGTLCDGLTDDPPPDTGDTGGETDTDTDVDTDTDTDSPNPDTGRLYDTNTGNQTTGCSCDTARSVSRWSWLLLALLANWGRRRRR